MMKIYFKNGSVITYDAGDYTDYKYDGKSFIVIYNNQWIGIYNMDCIGHIWIERADVDLASNNDCSCGETE